MCTLKKTWCVLTEKPGANICKFLVCTLKTRRVCSEKDLVCTTGKSLSTDRLAVYSGKDLVSTLRKSLCVLKTLCVISERLRMCSEKDLVCTQKNL